MEQQKSNQIQNKVPLENDSQEKHLQYSEELDKFISHYSSRQLSDIDNNIINELFDESFQPPQEVTAQNNSIIGSLVTDQRDHKWD